METRAIGAAEQDSRALLDLVGAFLDEVGEGRGGGAPGLDVSLERDLGLGSLERVELIGRIERVFGVKLGAEAIASADTPRRLLELVRGAATDGGAPIRPSTPATPDSLAGARESFAQGERKQAGERRTTDLPAALKARGPAAPAPDRARTLIEALDYRAIRDRDRIHLVLLGEDGSEEAITYGDLKRDASAVAAGLRARGIGAAASGARPTVAIMLPTSRAYFASFMGALMAGGVPVPLYPPFRLDRIAEYVARQSKILDSAAAEALITFERAARVASVARDRVPSLAHVIEAEGLLPRPGGAAERAFATPLSAAAGPDDTALIQYTSGSTGDPKGVELTHANVLSNVRAAAAGVDFHPEDIVVSWLPLYHDMGLIGGWLMNLYAGSAAVLLSPLAFLSRPERWLETITRWRATGSVAPNFAFELCTKRVDGEALARIDLSSLRTVLNGSEPVPPATIERFERKFAPRGFRRTAMFPAYGLAENMVGVLLPPVDRGPRIDGNFVSVGRPVLGTEVRLVDDSGREIAEDRREGRLHFRGLSAFKGYYRNPEATAAAKLPDGWVDSGDLAYRLDGEYYITGRVKDLIIKGGRNYYPHEIEAAAGAVEGVRQGCVAAFGVRDDAQGTEQIVVVAETRRASPGAGEADRDALDALGRRVTQAVAAAIGVPPDRVVMVGPGAVPKTSSGKLRRTETRKLYLEGALGRSAGSFAWQAAGLALGSIPSRLKAAARRAGEIAYGAWGAGAFLSVFGAASALLHVTPSGRPMRRAGFAAAQAALALAGMRPRVRGLERIPAGPAILAPNHSSYLDMFVLCSALDVDTRYLVKGECRENRFFGPLVARAGHPFIERRVAERSLEDLRAVSDLLRRGERVVIFPEGTFFREAGLRPFKLGAFRIACDLGVPVVPVAIRGTRRAFRDGMWLPRRVPLEVEALDPILPRGRELADVIDLKERAAEALAARLDEPRLEPGAACGG